MTVRTPRACREANPASPSGDDPWYSFRLTRNTLWRPGSVAGSVAPIAGEEGLEVGRVAPAASTAPARMVRIHGPGPGGRNGIKISLPRLWSGLITPLLLSVLPEPAG